MNDAGAETVGAATLEALREGADSADRSPEWPATSWQRLRDAGALAWSIPREHGGAGWPTSKLLAGYGQLAGACMTTAFILSQREGAVRRLVGSSNAELVRRFLPGLARGEFYASVGLSQLTTSRQHKAPVLTATETSAGFRLDGEIPWVTGADQAALVTIGATLADGRQILLGLPRGQPGVVVEPPLPLMALAGSRTSSLRLSNVELGREWLIAGPLEKVVSGKPGGAGGLETSCLALGLARSAIEYVQHEAEQRPDLDAAAESLVAARARLQSQLASLALALTPTAESLVAIRVGCTQLALQATQVAMTVAKGTGFVAPHPVQLWARQALFFLVWSCPRPAAEGLIGSLLPQIECTPEDAI
jgi:butyryl-CoA dehydrogenase